MNLDMSRKIERCQPLRLSDGNRVLREEIIQKTEEKKKQIFFPLQLILKFCNWLKKYSQVVTSIQ